MYARNDNVLICAAIKSTNTSLLKVLLCLERNIEEDTSINSKK